MQRTTTLLLFGQLLCACAGQGDPGLPPGQGSDPGTDETGDASTVGDPTTGTSQEDTASTNVDESTGGAGEADSSGADGATSDTGPAEPACEGSCLAVPPEWNGPVAVHTSPIADEPPACPAAYPTAVGEWYADLVASDFSCDCGCEPDDAECPDQVSLSYYGNGGSCLAVSTSYALTQTCSSGPTGQNGHWQAATPDVIGGSCTPTSTIVPSLAAFTSRWTLCSGEPAPGACADDESCSSAPVEPFEDRLCIWMDGDVSCPAGEFSGRAVFHADFDDQRDCAECTCGEISGSCGGALRLYSANSCPAGGLATDVLTTQVGDCVEYDPESARLLEDLTPNDDLECEPSEGTPTGAAVPTNPITVCCTDEL